MRIVEEKLERFTNDIMSDVTAKRQEILSQVEERLDKIYKDKENEYINNSYEIIEKGLKHIDKEKNEIISKIIMDNRIKLLNKRTDIINNIFNSVIEEIRCFTEEEQYYSYLCSSIEQSLKEVGDGDKIVYINYNDEKYLEKLNDKFNNIIQLEEKIIDMLGGCKVHNINSNIFFDNSFAKKLQDQREGFLQKCKLEIE
jgi:vacuolar-type H+-ATPase subunit E/Vma4